MPTTLHLPALPELIQSIEKAGFQLLVAPVPVPLGGQTAGTSGAAQSGLNP